MFDISTPSAPTFLPFACDGPGLEVPGPEVPDLEGRHSSAEVNSTAQLEATRRIPGSNHSGPTMPLAQHLTVAAATGASLRGGGERIVPRTLISFSNQLPVHPALPAVLTGAPHSAALGEVTRQTTKDWVDRQTVNISLDATSLATLGPIPIESPSCDSIPHAEHDAVRGTAEKGEMREGSDALGGAGLGQGLGYSMSSDSEDGITVLRAVHHAGSGLQIVEGSKDQPDPGLHGDSDPFPRPCAHARGAKAREGFTETYSKCVTDETNTFSKRTDRLAPEEPPAYKAGETVVASSWQPERRVWLRNALPPAQPPGIDCDGIRSEWLSGTGRTGDRWQTDRAETGSERQWMPNTGLRPPDMPHRVTLVCSQHRDGSGL